MAFVPMAHTCMIHAQESHDIYVTEGSDIRKAFIEAQNYADDSLWTNVYIAPGVYWLDDPDADVVRYPDKDENIPYAVKLHINRTRIVGVGSPDDVVLAVNRGQTQGAYGNYTMMFIDGTDNEVRNITFGNYCNVDLVYPRNPNCNRPKRCDAIVQAQLVICNGGVYHIDSCRFISRLNLCPFVGSERTYFSSCYFECTDDALCGSGVYDHCSFTLFSSKPFYCTSSEGAILNDCDIYSKTRGVQYLTKVADKITLNNCRWTSDDPSLTIEWTKKPDPRRECIMNNCTLNGKPLYVKPSVEYPLPVTLPSFPVSNQPDIVAGRWTIDSYKPKDTEDYDWSVSDENAWCYGEGVDGAEGVFGLVQRVKGARLMYTPEPRAYGDMHVRMNLDPCKSAGQGFGSATGQYLDVCLKFDTRALTGYGIRFFRTPTHDKAIEVALVEYTDCDVRFLTEPQLCTIYKRGCQLSLDFVGQCLSATIVNGGETQQLSVVLNQVNIYGGIHIQHTGSTGASATVISGIKMWY